MMLRCCSVSPAQGRSRCRKPHSTVQSKALPPRRALLTLLGSTGCAGLVSGSALAVEIMQQAPYTVAALSSAAPPPAAVAGLPAPSQEAAQVESQLSRAVGPTVEAPPLAEAPVRLEDRVPMNAPPPLAPPPPVFSPSEKAPSSTPVSDKGEKGEKAKPENGGKTEQQVEEERKKQEEEERKKQRRRKKGRIKELEELRAELAQKQKAVVENEEELLTKEQTAEVLKEEVGASPFESSMLLAMERKLRGLLTKELKQAEEEAALAMGLCGAGTLLP